MKNEHGILINVSEEDFNLTKEYELFDVIYSVSKGYNDNQIKAWTVIGHVLNNSANKRCFEYELCTYPIAVAISSNEKCKLSDISNHHFISRDRKEVIKLKKAFLSEYFDNQLNKLV